MIQVFCVAYHFDLLCTEGCCLILYVSVIVICFCNFLLLYVSVIVSFYFVSASILDQHKVWHLLYQSLKRPANCHSKTAAIAPSKIRERNSEKITSFFNRIYKCFHWTKIVSLSNSHLIAPSEVGRSESSPHIFLVKTLPMECSFCRSCCHNWRSHEESAAGHSEDYHMHGMSVW